MTTAEWWRSYRKRKKEGGNIRPINYREYNKEWLEYNNLKIEIDENEPFGYLIQRYVDKWHKWTKIEPHKMVGCPNDHYNIGSRNTVRVTFNGYPQVGSTEKKLMNMQLSTLIYTAFVGDIPKGMVVHHKDGNPLNNCISNLELLTRAENARIDAQHHNQYTDPQQLKWVN